MLTRLAESPGRPLEWHGNVSPREMTVHGASAPGQNPAYRPAHSLQPTGSGILGRLSASPRGVRATAEHAVYGVTRSVVRVRLHVPVGVESSGRGLVPETALHGLDALAVPDEQARIVVPESMVSRPGGNPRDRYERNGTSQKHQGNSRPYRPRPPTKQRDGRDERDRKRQPQYHRRCGGRSKPIADEAVSWPGVGEDAYLRSRGHGNGPDQQDGGDCAQSHDRRPHDQARRGSFCSQLSIADAHTLIVRVH